MASGKHPEAQDMKVEPIGSLLSLRNMTWADLTPICRNSPGVLSANAAVTMVVMAMYHGTDCEKFATRWGVASLVFTLASFAVIYSLGRMDHSKTRAYYPAAILAALISLRGLWWAVAMIFLLPANVGENQLVLGWILAGLMCAGAYAYWPLPLAALAYSGLVGLGGAFGMLAGGGLAMNMGAVAAGGFFLLLSRVVVWQVRGSRESDRARQALAAKNEVIGLLLRDFEENANDFLWETDSEGRLTRGAGAFARLLNQKADDLENELLAEILFKAALDPHQRRSAIRFGVHLNKKQSFSDCRVFCGADGGERVLSFAAKPTRDAAGNFTGWRGVASDQTDAHLAEAKVYRLAHFDSLTDLPNRLSFHEKLSGHLSAGEARDLWIMYLDLDGFKQVNDTLGHAAGDRLLAQVSERFRATIDASAFLSRLGGDEFALLVHASPMAVDALWRDLVKAVARTVTLDGQDVSIGVSIGIVKADSADLTSDELMRRADMALYRAKEEGRGTARYYEPFMDAQVVQRRQMEGELKAAIARNQLELDYQPIFAAGQQTPSSFEALLRWRHPRLGRITPDQFLPLAEETGIIHEIGAWVLHRACQDARRWPSNIKLAVNMSPMQVRTPRILPVLVNALAEAGLEAGRLEIELTELAILESFEQVQPVLDGLRALGIAIVLDDFGTGQSSLSNLHRYRFDKLKIDREFVQSFATRKESAAVVRAALLIARELDIVTVAEGIESEAQLEALVAEGCHQLQGYFLAIPQPVEKLPDVFQFSPGVQALSA
jgi:diguanylate cyclase (GGDEF)-like protein/PAS domain S-box-containing protein